jgi:hypothetical protein
LLHTAAVGTLATHARQPEGFPYPSMLPFAPDPQHHPTILVSRLAEHTHNLHADPRAGFLVVDAPDGDVLSGQRVTLLGAFEPVDPTPEVVRRYLRYHPDAERYLVLGDFTFWTMRLERLRYSKFWASTAFCAPSMRLEIMRDSMGTPSSMPRRWSSVPTHSRAKMRMRSSSRERKKREAPGSP